MTCGRNELGGFEGQYEGQCGLRLVGEGRAAGSEARELARGQMA